MKLQVPVIIVAVINFVIVLACRSSLAKRYWVTKLDFCMFVITTVVATACLTYVILYVMGVAE